MSGWFQALLGKKEKEPKTPVLETDLRPARVMTRHLYRAAHAHLGWQKRLRDVIQGESDEVLDPEAISADWSCALGKWIYNPGQANYSHLPAFPILKARHAEFHDLAGQILTHAKNGQRIEAQRLLLGPFTQAFDAIMTALDELDAQAEAMGTKPPRSDEEY